MTANKIEEFRVHLGFDSALAVDKTGRSGGLAILWRQPFDCTVLSYSSNFINVKVSSVGS